MIIKAYSFLDTKIGVFSNPMFFLHEGQAMRMVTELVSDLSTSIGRHPADFHLHLVGEFNDNTGVYTVIGPVNMGPALNWLPKRQEVMFAEKDI